MIDLIDVRFTTAPEHLHAGGLLGWLRIVTGDGLILDGIGVRRTLRGALTLSFPERVARDGRRHPVIRPLDDRVRREFEDVIFGRLGFDKPEAAP